MNGKLRIVFTNCKLVLRRGDVLKRLGGLGTLQLYCVSDSAPEGRHFKHFVFENIKIIILSTFDFENHFGKIERNVSS